MRIRDSPARQSYADGKPSSSASAPEAMGRRPSRALLWPSASAGADGTGTASPGVGDGISDSALQYSGDFAYLSHEVVELLGEERLFAIAEGAVGIRVDFDDETVSPNRNRGPGQWRDLVALAGSVAGIDDDRQMAQPLHRGNHAEIERVASVIGEGAHAALAQDHVVVALAHDVFGGHQKFFHRGRQAALQQHGFMRFTGALQQREILHVARADLDDVTIFLDQVQRFVVDGLGDDQQPEAVTDLRQDLQAIFSQALKRVRRSAWLVRASTKELRARAGDTFGGGQRLLAAFDGARAGDHGHLVAAEARVRTGEADDRVFFLHVAADELVRLADADDFLHPRHLVESAGIELRLIAGDADGGALCSGNGVCPETQRVDLLAHAPHLLFGGVRLHDDKH